MAPQRPRPSVEFRRTPMVVPADIVAAGMPRSTVARAGSAESQAPPPVRSLTSPYEVPPPGSIEFNGYAQLSSNAIEIIEFTTAALQVEELRYAVISSVDFYINDMTPATEVFFRVLRNGNRVPGLDNVRIFPRNATSVSRGFDPFLRLNPLDRVTFFYQNVTGLPHLLGVTFFGWSWSRDIHMAFGEREAS